MSTAEAAPPQGAQPGPTSFKSMADMWHHRIRSTPDSDAMLRKRGDEWVTMSWREAGARVRSIANGLLAAELADEERVCILGGTSIEWILADMAIVCAGGATTTIYPSNTPEECAYIINDCGAVAVFVDDADQAAKLLEVRDRLVNVKAVYIFDGTGSADGWITPLADLEAAGDAFGEAQPDAYDTASNAVTPDRLATLIYTSGTTGRPKGVMITHDSWVYVADAIDKQGILSAADKQFLFLPLAHVFAKINQVIFIRLGVPTSVDGSIPDLIENLGQQRPTFMGAVPRVFEKAYNKIVSNAREAGGVKYSLFKWSVGVGRQVSQLRQDGKEPRGMLALKYRLADRLVFGKVKAVFGGRLRFLISGGAPLSPEIAEFFHACDILILEGYGMTETTAASCVNTPSDYQFGTVGQPIPGTEVKISEDGEILIRSRGCMKGYYNLPDKTAETLEPDGWLHTGDLGTKLDTGHVKITGRKKDLIITAGGKNIGPAHFQNKLKSQSTWVSQVLMHGDRRNFCVALITINEESVGNWARANGVSYTDYADLASRAEVKALVQADVDVVNKDLPSYETVKKIHLCPEDWTTENGLLTPSMKVKRSVVEAHYKDALDAFYAGSVARV